MIKYLLFDLDGTLTDSQEGLCKSFQYALAAYGITENNEENLKRFIGPPAHYAFCEFYNFTEKDAIAAVEIFRERFSKIGIYENRLYDGIFEMLDELKDHGFKLALATAKPKHFADVVIDYFNIEQFFDVKIGATMDNKNHDKSQIIKDALSEFRASPHEAIMIGDRKFDIQAAKAAGIKSIGVEYGYAPPGELAENNADYIIKTVDELKNLLLNFNEAAT